jgi:hypothetical protein
MINADIHNWLSRRHGWQRAVLAWVREAFGSATRQEIRHTAIVTYIAVRPCVQKESKLKLT